MRKIDFERKAKVLNNGLYSYFRQINKDEYVKGEKNKVADFCNWFVVTSDDWNEADKDLRECWRLKNADFKRRLRLQDRIEAMMQKCSLLDETMIFFTLTFDNTSIEYKSKRKIVQNWLKTYCYDYVANADYCPTTDREHYHALGILKDQKKRINRDLWTYGFSTTERVNIGVKDKRKLSEYMTKLTNHGIKETTKITRLIYSR